MLTVTKKLRLVKNLNIQIREQMIRSLSEFFFTSEDKMRVVEKYQMFTMKTKNSTHEATRFNCLWIRIEQNFAKFD